MNTAPLLWRSGFNQLKECKHGFMLYNKHDWVIGASLSLYGEFTEEEIHLFKQILRPGDVAVDVGANIGTHTVPLCQLVGPQGKVFSFEPQRIIYQTLCANLALNSLTNGYAFNLAVGAEAGQTTLVPPDYTQTNNFGAMSLGRSEEGERVQVITLDQVDLPACRLIKVDVEGMEEEVIKGAVKTIQKFRPVLYIENNRSEKSDTLIRAVNALGYSMHWHRVPYFNPNNFYQNPDHALARFGTEPNMLCVPKEVNQPLQGFEPVSVPQP